MLPTDPVASRFPSLGALAGSLIQYALVFAGLFLLIMLIAGGVKLMTAGGDQNKVKEGYGQITNGLIGFLIVFVSYFVVQIVELVFGIQIM